MECIESLMAAREWSLFSLDATTQSASQVSTMMSHVCDCNLLHRSTSSFSKSRPSTAPVKGAVLSMSMSLHASILCRRWFLCADPHQDVFDLP